MRKQVNNSSASPASEDEPEVIALTEGEIKLIELDQELNELLLSRNWRKSGKTWTKRKE